MSKITEEDLPVSVVPKTIRFTATMVERVNQWHNIEVPFQPAPKDAAMHRAQINLIAALGALEDRIEGKATITIRFADLADDLWLALRRLIRRGIMVHDMTGRALWARGNLIDQWLARPAIDRLAEVGRRA